MSKNAVVLMLAVLFMAMVLVVVNQLLYSDSDQQPIPTPGTNQGPNSAFNNLGKLPLDSDNSTGAPSVPASQLGRAEQSPWAQSVEQRNMQNNATSNDGIVHSQPVQKAGQSTYNNAARQMADNSTGAAEPVSPGAAPETPRADYKPAWSGNAGGANETNGTTAAAPEPVKAPPVAAPAKPEAQKPEPGKSQPAADAKKPEPAKAVTPPKENAKPEQTAPSTPAAAVKKSGPATINQVGLHFADKRMVLRVNGDAPFETKWFVLTGPDRLVVDFPEPVKNLTVPTIPQNRMVKGARIGRQKDGFRLVLDLNAPVKVESKNDKAGNLEVFME